MALIRVRLTPRGGRNGIDGVEDGIVRARVTAPAIKGAANQALCEMLAKVLQIPKSNVSIHAGETSRVKKIEIYGADSGEVLAMLAKAGGRPPSG